jgi:hypothetical protein
MASPQVTSFGMNYHHIASVPVDDRTASGIVSHLLDRAPCRAIVLTSTDLSPALREGQYTAIRGDHYVWYAYRLIEILDLEDLTFIC